MVDVVIVLTFFHRVCTHMRDIPCRVYDRRFAGVVTSRSRGANGVVRGERSGIAPEIQTTFDSQTEV